MWAPLWQGLALGLSLSLITGPIFFTIVQTSLRFGWKSGALVGIGIAISDTLLILAAYFGLKQMEGWIAQPEVQLGMAAAGSLVLISIGIAMWMRLNPTTSPARFPMIWRQAGHLITGFLINTLNPFTVLFWITITGSIVFASKWSAGQSWVFYGTLLFIITGTDIVKAVVAQQLTRWLKPHYLRRVQQLVAAALICFGLLLVARTLWTLY